MNPILDIANTKAWIINDIAPDHAPTNDTNEISLLQKKPLSPQPETHPTFVV